MVLEYEKQGKIAKFTINRPYAMNSLGEGLGEQLLSSLKDFQNDPQLWVGILTATGDRAFCVGADLKSWAQGTGKAPKITTRQSNYWHEMTHELQLWKPMIAAINGYALGGGLELALLCDIRIAAEHARFGLPEVTRGFMPGGGGIQRLTRMLNRCHAAEILLTGKHISAEEAYRIGLINKVVPMEKLMLTTMEYAETIAQAAPLSARAVKEAMIRGSSMTLAEAFKLDRQLSSHIMVSEDFSEGVNAFAQKRKPVWKGK